MTYDNTSLIDAMFSMADSWGCDCSGNGPCNQLRTLWSFSDAVKIELDKGSQGHEPGDSKGTYATESYAFSFSKKHSLPTIAQ